MKKGYLEAGEFVTTHGVTGELRLYPWGDGPAFLCGFNTLYLDEQGKSSIHIASIRPHKNICLVKLDGVDSIEQARPYIGRTVYISRADVQLPEGRFFVQDLLGARVVDAHTGEDYGKILSVSHPGRHDVYEIEHPDGKRSLFPAVEPYLVELDVEGGVVKIAPIEGMLDGSAPLPKSPDKKR